MPANALPSGVPHDLIHDIRHQFGRLYESIVEESLIGVVIIQDSKVLYANPRLCVMFGYRQEEAIGRPIAEFVSPEDRALVAENIRRRIEGEIKSLHYEFTGTRRDGEAIPIETLGTRIDFEDRPALVSTLIDISDRKREEDTLRFLTDASRVLASSLDYETVLGLIAHLAVPRVADMVLIHLLQEDGSLRRVGAAHRDPARSALVEELRTRFSNDPDTDCGPVQVVRTGQAELLHRITELDLRRRARDPEHLALLHRLSARSAMIVPLRGRGRTLGAIGLFSCDESRLYGERDLAMAQELADRCGLTIENVRLYLEAKEAVRTRDLFFSIASHELKTPLTSLQSAIELVMRETAEGRAASKSLLRRLCANAHDQSVRLVRMINSLLDLSRVSTGRLHIESEELDLRDVAREAIERLGTALERSGCQAILLSPEPVRGLWDRARLDEILNNLLTNAMKYGSGKPIEVFVQGGPHRVRLVVRDHGPGIAPADQEKLFQPFRRMTARHRSGSLGLGLFIVRQIALAHGGSVHVNSRIGQGSDFIVELPRRAPRDTEVRLGLG